MFSYLRLLVMMPLLRGFLLLEEDFPDGAPATKHEQLLAEIGRVGRIAVRQGGEHINLYSTIGTIKQRRGFWRASCGEMRVWRLSHLHQPLWLGADGIVYHAYGRVEDSLPLLFGFDHRPPAYWVRAPLEGRDERSLKRILDGLEDLSMPEQTSTMM